MTVSVHFHDSSVYFHDSELVFKSMAVSVNLYDS